jgi:hypothetical protein
MNNPLRQYFRRPALYISLPSKGNYYPPGAIEIPENGELPVFPMTAIDEITTKTPDALFNGVAICDIIKSCVPGIKDPWFMPSMDIDAVLIAIRAATNGNDLEIESICPAPECNQEAKYGVNLVGLLSGMSAGDYGSLLNLGDLKIKIRPLNYKNINKGNLSQFEMQREIVGLENLTDEDERKVKSNEAMMKISKLNIDMMATSIEYIIIPSGEQVDKPEYIIEFLENCDRNTHDVIRKQIGLLRETSTTKPQKIKCIHCQHEYDQPIALNVTDFFG